VIRLDTQQVLGVVGPSYTPLQNLEAFEWFNAFIEAGFVEFETAGSLFNGRKIFILAKIKSDAMDIQKDDPVESFILLSNSHDGSTAVRVGYTPIRVVCNNTLKLAHQDNKSQLIRVRHTYQVQNNITAIAETMDLVNQQFLATAEKFKWLASRDIVTTDLERYIRQVFSIKSLESYLSDEEEADNKSIKIIEAVTERFESEDNQNWWTAYNSVQGYLQHEQGSSRSSLEGRYDKMWFGNKDVLNRKALELALSY
jgi:phage/plasmid-like protein (TIGR03299 family)